MAKNHSVTSDAVAAGRGARAARTLLTHFSQRYPKVPVLDPDFQATAAVAFDLMSVDLAGEQGRGGGLLLAGVGGQGR